MSRALIRSIRISLPIPIFCLLRRKVDGYGMVTYRSCKTVWKRCEGVGAPQYKSFMGRLAPVRHVSRGQRFQTGNGVETNADGRHPLTLHRRHRLYTPHDDRVINLDV